MSAQTGEGGFDPIKDALTVQGIAFEEDDGWLTVPRASEDGFDVHIQRRDDEWIVTFGDIWHQHLDTAEAAKRSLLYGLSDQCRLVSVFRGGIECRATVELRDGDRWQAHHTTGLLVFPFWRKRIVRTRQNRMIGEVAGGFPDGF